MGLYYKACNYGLDMKENFETNVFWVVNKRHYNYYFNIKLCLKGCNLTPTKLKQNFNL